MSLSTKLRFEIFKRDKFTCQYCGRSAPDVTLQVDHIDPSSKGGSDDILNLITSCRECNHGKSNIPLSDDAAIKKRKTQLDALQERREQLTMLFQWQESLIDLEQETIERLAQLWIDFVPGYTLNERGLAHFGKWRRRFSIEEIIDAIKVVASQYLVYDDEAENPMIPLNESVQKAFSYIPKVCANARKMKEKPYLKDLYYARGILKNRIDMYRTRLWKCIDLMESAHITGGIPTEEIKEFCKTVNNWGEFIAQMSIWTQSKGS